MTATKESNVNCTRPASTTKCLLAEVERHTHTHTHTGLQGLMFGVNVIYLPKVSHEWRLSTISILWRQIESIPLKGFRWPLDGCYF